MYPFIQKKISISLYRRNLLPSKFHHYIMHIDNAGQDSIILYMHHERQVREGTEYMKFKLLLKLKQTTGEALNY